MLTNNFMKWMMLPAANQKLTKPNGSKGTVSMPKYYTTAYGNTNLCTIDSDVSGCNFIDELTPPVANEYQVVDGIYNAYYCFGSNSSSAGHMNRLGMLVGTGDTPPTKDDYKLASQVVLDSAPTDSITFVNGTTIKLVKEFINNTESSVIIKEVGVYILSCSGYGSSQTIQCYLIARKLLDQPVEIAVGSNAVFTYNIDMSTIIPD